MASPPPIVPVPATQFSRLRGSRVIIGVPGIGFRGDLRADDPVVQKGRTYVPVLAESDYYRAEAEGVELFAPLVPIDRVWVESVTQDPNTRAATTPLDAPTVRQPLAASGQRGVLGVRVVQSVPDGFVRDLRAVTDVFSDATGAATLRVCGEDDWYRWAFSGSIPSSIEVPASTVWLE